MILATQTLHRADYIVLIGYFALMLAIGVYFFRSMRGMKDYFSGGNRIPWWLSGVSFYMSSFSVAAFVQYSALAYNYGWVAVTLYWVTVPATLVSVIFFSARWRRARIDSPIEYLEARYSPLMRQVFAWQGIPVLLIDNALKLVAIGMFISPILGWSLPASMLASGLIMLAYTFMGGLWAVAVTDFIQFVVMTVAVVVLIPLSLAETNGVRAFIHNAPEGFFRLTNPEYSWVYIVSNILLFSLAFSSIQWSLIQRYYCVPREKDAYRVGALVVVLNIIGPPLMFLPAMAARQFLDQVDNDGAVYSLLCNRLLPAGMVGLVVAAMFAATMSMLSSNYNVCASVLTNDVYRRLIRPNASQRHLVRVGRGMTLVVGAVALAVALGIGDIGGEGLFRYMIKLFSIATAPVAIPMIAGLLSRRVTGRAAFAGFLAGVVAGLVLFLVGDDQIRAGDVTFKKENIILFGTTTVTLVTIVLVSVLGYRRPEEERRADAFARRLATPIGCLDEDRDPVADQVKISPFRVVGVSTLAIGGMMLGIVASVQNELARQIDLWIGLSLALAGGFMVVLSYRRSELQEEST